MGNGVSSAGFIFCNRGTPCGVFVPNQQNISVTRVAPSAPANDEKPGLLKSVQDVLNASFSHARPLANVGYRGKACQFVVGPVSQSKHNQALVWRQVDPGEHGIQRLDAHAAPLSRVQMPHAASRSRTSSIDRTTATR